MLKIKMTKRAQKFLIHLPLKQAQQIKRKLYALLEDPIPNDSKKLVGYSNYRRADAGEYRIIYRVEGDSLFVPLIGKRNDGDVYKKLQQLGVV